MKNLMLAVTFLLAMGTLVSCNQDSATESKPANDVLVVCCDGDTTVAKPMPKQPQCDCDAVEKKFAEVKANRDSTYATATAQLEAQLTSKPSCLKFNGNKSWTCGKYSGRDAGNKESQLVLGGF